MVGQTTSSDLSPHTAPATHANGSSLRTEVNSAVDTAKQYAKAAQDTLQSQGERVKGLAQGLAGTDDVQSGRIMNIHMSAPLESGSHTTLGTISRSSAKPEIAENEPKAS